MKRLFYLALLIIVIVSAIYHYQVFNLADEIEPLIQNCKSDLQRIETTYENTLKMDIGIIAYKLKTGFTGEIEDRNGSFYHLLGSWRDVSIRDRNSAIAAANKILEGIKPYLKGDPAHWGKSKVIYYGSDGCIIKFPQYIQGIEVENHHHVAGMGIENQPGITMHFMSAKSSLVNISIIVVPDSAYGSKQLISKEQADLINRELSGRKDSADTKISLIYYQYLYHDNPDTPKRNCGEDVMVPPVDCMPYLPDRLYWKIDTVLFGTPHAFYIDAITGIQSEFAEYYPPPSNAG